MVDSEHMENLQEVAEIEIARILLEQKERRLSSRRRGGVTGHRSKNQDGQPTRIHHMPIGERTLAQRGHAG